MLKKHDMENLHHLIMDCNSCILNSTKRNKPVFGEGSLDAKVMLIGEAPGYNEEKQGRPFVGRAGKVLDQLLDSIKLKRSDIFITNLILCRPPNNRKPLKNEIEMCNKYLDAQIEIIEPKIIVPMGDSATSYILKKYGLKIGKISDIHGKVFRINKNSDVLKIIPLFHPAVIIYNNNKKKILFDDFEKIKKENHE